MASNVQQIVALAGELLGSTITQFFGPTSYAGEPSNYGYPHFHTGVDIVLPRTGDVSSTGPNVRAVSSGVVTAVIPSSTGFGNHVIVTSPNGFTYLYGHLHDFGATLFNSGQQANQNLQVGDQVHVGDIIGHEGSTGNSSGPHLHLEVRAPNGLPVDLGRTPQAIIYSLYHSLGWGAGYLAGQNPDFIPSATQPGPPGQYTQVPYPLPTNPDISSSPNCNPPPCHSTAPGDVRFAFGKNGLPGAPDPVGIIGGDPTNPGSGTDPVTGVPISYPGAPGYIGLSGNGFFQFLNQPGGIFNNSAGSIQQVSEQSGGIDPGKILVFAAAGFMGAVFVIVGLIKLGKEEPVKVVVSPVVETAKTAGKGAAAVAAVAA